MIEEPLFRFESVRVGAEGAWRLRGVDAEVGGGCTAVIGPSGSGKSTLLRCCNRLVVPERGRVRFRGADLADLDPRRLRRRIGMVFQRPTPFPGSGLDNLRVADPELAPGAAAALLARVGLDDSFLGREALALSGGEAQRLCLARALAAGPEVLLMDEVTASVDPVARTGLEVLARELTGTGMAVLWVGHDLAQVRRVAERVLVMIDGCVAHAAPVADLGRGAPPAVADFLEEAARAG